MYLLYSLLLSLGLLAAAPWFLIDAIRSGKYITGLSQRLGKVPRLNSNDRPIIWLHCVSVGETAAARTLVTALRRKLQPYRLVISTTTITGQHVARRLFAEDVIETFYFPIDWGWSVRRVLNVVQPAAVLIMETELWPRLFRECRRRKIPVMLVNGRLSARSFRRYKMAGGFIRRVLNDLSLALIQSEQDAARFRDLGLSNDRIRITGNLKFDAAQQSADPDVIQMLHQRFGFGDGRTLIVAASTHDPEERILLDAFKNVSKQCNARLLIAPRHPERFDEVASLLSSSGLACSRRSHPRSPADTRADVVLLDTIGELAAAYALADVAFVGGSIAPNGGHNVLEPAALGVCVLTGPHMENFTAVNDALVKENALVKIDDLSESNAATKVASTLIELLSDAARRRAIGERAQALCRRNTGATELSANAIADVINRSPAADSISFSSATATATK